MTKEAKQLGTFTLIALMILTWTITPERALFASSLSDLKRALSLTSDQIQQLRYLRLIGFAIGALFAGPICDHYGRRKVLVWGMLAYCASSAFGALSHGVTELMRYRFLQGFTIAAPLIASYTMIFDGTSGERRVFWTSIGNGVGTLFVLAALVLGDLINGKFGYRANIWAILAIGVIGSLPALIWTKETLVERRADGFSLRSAFSGYVALCKDKRFVTLGFSLCALLAIVSVYMEFSFLYVLDHLGMDRSHFVRYWTFMLMAFVLSSMLSSFLVQRFSFKATLHAGLMAMCIGLFQFFPVIAGLALFSIVANWFLWRFPFRTGICISLAIAALATLVFFCSSLLLHKSIVCTVVLMMVFMSGMAIVASILWPTTIQRISPDLFGRAHAMFQAVRFGLMTLVIFVTDFVGMRPSLPVATVLASMLCLSLAVLCYGKKFIKAELRD